MNYSEIIKTVAEVVVAFLGLLTAAWGALKYVFAPRIEIAVAAGVKPIALRVDAVEDRQSKTDQRIEGISAGQERSERAIERVGVEIKDGLDGLALAVEKLSESNGETREDVAFIRGTLGKKAIRPRAPKK
jgi:hypothetical protein